ncbi:multidrug effflux MFS transporter [Fluviibacterium sp. S390]|uniref:multidrug effflux MFS transporter n=1 Tax=Fluviibacterium sp. S390 TaxID=3415139 RepID=UPI003C7B989C
MTQPQRPERRPISRVEFVAMMAMIVAIVAFSLDAMLPAIPEIGASLSPERPERASLTVPFFALGMGLGTLFVGPLADAFGRKPILFGFVALYCAGAALAVMAETMNMLLLARVIQGLGAAGPRIVVTAVVRDRHSGRDMARLMSFIMMVFALVPAIAPAAGALILAVAGWRAIFLAFIVFAVLVSLWYGLRQPETLDPADRRPLNFGRTLDGARETLSHDVVRRSILVQILVFGMLFGNLSTIQPSFDQIYGKGAEFPAWFALIACFGAFMGFVNAKVVMRAGMRKVIRNALCVQFACSVLFLCSGLANLGTGTAGFAAYYLWATSVFLLVSFVLGNLNALALEPLGHLAGTASSVIAALSTVGAALVTIPVTLAFSSASPMPVALVMSLLTVPALFLMWRVPRDAPQPA